MTKTIHCHWEFLNKGKFCEKNDENCKLPWGLWLYFATVWAVRKSYTQLSAGSSFGFRKDSFLWGNINKKLAEQYMKHNIQDCHEQ